MANQKRKTKTGIWINRNGKPITQTKSYLLSHVGEGNKIVPTAKRKSRW